MGPTLELTVHVRDANLDEVGGPAGFGWLLLATNVGDDPAPSTLMIL